MGHPSSPPFCVSPSVVGVAPVRQHLCCPQCSGTPQYSPITPPPPVPPQSSSSAGVGPLVGSPHLCWAGCGHFAIPCRLCRHIKGTGGRGLSERDPMLHIYTSTVAQHFGTDAPGKSNCVCIFRPYLNCHHGQLVTKPIWGVNMTCVAPPTAPTYWSPLASWSCWSCMGHTQGFRQDLCTGT